MTDTLVTDIIQALKDNNGDIGDAVKDLHGEYLENNFLEHGSWSIYYETIVKVQGRYFRIIDEVPATEMQEGQDETQIILVEVDPHEVVKVVYKIRSGAKKIRFYTD